MLSRQNTCYRFSQVGKSLYFIIEYIIYNDFDLQNAIWYIVGHDLYNGQTEVSCTFKRPLFMPGRATLKIQDFQELYGEEGAELIVEERDTGVPHLKATVKVM